MAIQYNINKDYIVSYYRNEEKYIELQPHEHEDDYCQVIHRYTGNNILCQNPHISMIINSSHFITQEDINEEKQINIVFDHTEQMDDFENELISNSRFIKIAMDLTHEHLACNFKDYIK